MSSPSYRIINRIYSFDKTKLITTSRPTLYANIDAANEAAVQWLRSMSVSGEKVCIVRYKVGGMHVWANKSAKGLGVSAEAEVVVNKGDEAMQLALGKLKIAE